MSWKCLCLCWGFTAQSTQWGHVECGQFTYPHIYWAGLVLWAVNQYCVHSFARNWQLPFLNQRKWENDRRKYFMIKSPWKNVADPGGGGWGGVGGSNPQPPDHQSDTHPTEPQRPAAESVIFQDPYHTLKQFLFTLTSGQQRKMCIMVPCLKKLYHLPLKDFSFFNFSEKIRHSRQFTNVNPNFLVKIYHVCC